MSGYPDKSGIKSCGYLAAESECEECNQEISCFRKIAGILSSEEIRAHGLITNAIASNYQPTVYDLTLGSFHYIYGAIRHKDGERWTPVCIGSDQELAEQNKDRDGDDKFVRQYNQHSSQLKIPALGSALIQLNEIVDTYNIAEKRNILVTARFDLKLSLVNRGLISQQGTQVEPCYYGRLFCFVHNFSNEDITLTYHQPIASIEFSYVSCFCNDDKRRDVIQSLIKNNLERYNENDCCEMGKGIINIRYFRRNKNLPDDCGLYNLSTKAIAAVTEDKVITEISEKVTKKIDKRNVVIVAIITAAGTIIAAFVTGWFGLLQPIQKDYEALKNQITQEQTEVATFGTRIQALEDQLRGVTQSAPPSNK